MDEMRTSRGILTMPETAHYLDIPVRTVNRWARRDDGGYGLLHTVDAGRRRANMTFLAIAEAWVLDGFRSAGVRLQKVRPALDVLRREFSNEYILTAKELATDGVAVLWDYASTRAGDELLEPLTSQLLIRETVEDHLKYVGWDSEGQAETLRVRKFEPAVVVIDPRVAFGLPTFKGSRLRVEDVARFVRAGESDDRIIDELGVTPEVVTATRKFVLRAA